jgi:hypothetical protein
MKADFTIFFSLVFAVAASPLVAWTNINSLLKNSDSRLFKKVQMQGAREIDERRRIY